MGIAKYMAKPRVNMGRYYTESGTLKAQFTRDPSILYKLEKDKFITQRNSYSLTIIFFKSIFYLIALVGLLFYNRSQYGINN